MPASARQRSTPAASRSILHAERLEHVGRSTVARGGAVPVLGDGHAGAADDDRRHRGDVERAAAVAAGADDVDRPAPGRHRVANDEHRARRDPRPRRRSRPWCAAPSGSRRSGPAEASPAMIRAHHLGRLVGASATRARPDAGACAARRSVGLGHGSGTLAGRIGLAQGGSLATL